MQWKGKQFFQQSTHGHNIPGLSPQSPFCDILVCAPHKLLGRLKVMFTNEGRRDRELQKKVNILFHQPSVLVWAGSCTTFTAAMIGSHKIKHLSETEQCSRARPPERYDIWETHRLGPAGGGGTGV